MSRIKSDMITIGGIEDHVHLLVRFPTTLAIATLLKEVKGTSSHLVTHEIAPTEFFKWQGAYGAFTVHKDGVERVAYYINHQKQHHSDKSLIDDWEKCEIEE
ncbi:MAG TPA: transposase [Anaerolineae bacterium]|nr:transposase [Anaerolineae bacterium]